MPFTVKRYGIFSPHYTQLYGDFGRGLKVIHRRVITEKEVDAGDDLPDSIEALGAGDELLDHVNYNPDCTTFLLLAWKQKSSIRSSSSTRRYYVLLEFQNSHHQQTVVALSSDEAETSAAPVHIYKLYSSKHKQRAEQALQEIKSSLEPLFMTPLSEKLLKDIILPQPIERQGLQKVMSEYIVTKVPKRPKDWRDLLHSNKDSLHLHATDTDAIGVMGTPGNPQQLIVGDPITGTTIVHLAVKQGHKCLRETLEAIQQELPQETCKDLINRPNKDGFSTVIRPRRRSVAVLVSVKTQSFDEQDSQETPSEDLSTASTKSAKSSKVYSFELGAVTPLMLAARQNCVRSVHYLLAAGADPNCQDSIKGMSALHIAAVLCNVLIVKLLLCFEADLTLTNADGKTPLDIVGNRSGKEAEDCLKVMQKIRGLRDSLDLSLMSSCRIAEHSESESKPSKNNTCTHDVITGKTVDDNDQELPNHELMLSATVHLEPEQENHSNSVGKEEDERQENIMQKEEGEEVLQSTPSVGEDNVITLLSFDGGGTRGSICAFLLHKIEQKMRQISGTPDLQIRHYFNWYAGTSIGSVLALGMSHRNLTTSSLMAAIVNNRDEIFTNRRIYPSTPIEEYGKRLLGMDDIRSTSDPRILVTTVKADLDPPMLSFITNYRRETTEDEREWKVWEAARASTAAPTFFHPFEGKYVDGSILAVVPALHAMTDIQTYEKDKQLKLVLSLGTGEIETDKENPTPLTYLKVPKPPHFFSTLKSNYDGALALIMAAATSTEPAVSTCKAWCKMASIDFHRLSPPLSKSMRIDATSDAEFVLMFYESYIYYLERGQEFEKIAKRLLELGPRYHQQ